VLGWRQAAAEAGAVSAFGYVTRCFDCRVDCMPETPSGRHDWQRYMVHDDVWAAAGMRPDGGWLCAPCLQVRLGRPLTGDDLTGCELNRPGRDDDTPLLHALKVAAEVARFRRAERRIW
jgi:hypothetical protein